jgi:hypothetical protein
LKAPSWYADWRHDAVHQLIDKQEILGRDYGLNDWPRWDYDVDAGTLIFSRDGEAKVVADIQVVGTTGSMDWLWALRNAHWPDDVTTDMEKVWQFGLDNEIEELTTDYLKAEDLNNLGWEMTAVAVRVLDALGAYRPQPRGKPGTLFLLIKSIRYVDENQLRCKESKLRALARRFFSRFHL